MNRSKGSWAHQAEGRQGELKLEDLGIFGRGTEAEARSQRKPAGRGCEAKDIEIVPEGLVPQKRREDMTLVKKMQIPKAVQ